MAETIEVHFGMLSGVGPRNRVLDAGAMPLWEVALLELSSRLKVVVNHRILGVR